MRLNFALSLLASPFLVEGRTNEQRPNLRGLEGEATPTPTPTEVEDDLEWTPKTRTKYGGTGWWNETLQGTDECMGATCAVYGDPHVKTCDGTIHMCYYASFSELFFFFFDFSYCVHFTSA